MNAWTTVFGFKALEESYKRGIRSLNMLVFPGTDLLQKSLLSNNVSERHVPNHTGNLVNVCAIFEFYSFSSGLTSGITAVDMDVVEPKRNDHLPSEGTGKSEQHSSTTHVQDDHEIKHEAVSVQSCFQASDVPECYFEPEDKFTRSAVETIGLHSSPILHDKLEVKKELILETAEHNIKF